MTGLSVSRMLLVLALAINSVAAESLSVSSDKPACCAQQLSAGGPLSDRSLYHLDNFWTNDAGMPLKLVSLRGKPQVAAMFFASCQFTCPVLVNDMKRIDGALPENVRTNVGFLLVSFDSERDTSEALATYRKLHGLPPHWTLLRGGSADVAELAALLGVRFKKDARGQFSHSNILTVLDSDGEIARQIIGLNRDAGDAVEVLGQSLVPRDKKVKAGQR